MQLKIWNMLQSEWRCYFNLKPMFIFTDFFVKNGENSIFLDFSKWWNDRFYYKPVMKQLFFRNTGHWFVTLRSCALCLFTSCMTSNRTAHNFEEVWFQRDYTFQHSKCICFDCIVQKNQKYFPPLTVRDHWWYL